jgi:hypothetical protein
VIHLGKNSVPGSPSPRDAPRHLALSTFPLNLPACQLFLDLLSPAPHQDRRPFIGAR